MTRSPSSPNTMPSSPAAEAAAACTSGASDTCFHCGLPLPARPFRSVSETGGGDRRFCCPSCRAVYEAVREAGLDAFYRLRAAAPHARPAAVDAPELTYFDHPDVQKGFIEPEDGLPSAHLHLSGTHCQACGWLIEQRLRRLPGIERVTLDYLGESVRVVWRPDRLRLSGILAAVDALGYRARPFDGAHRKTQAVEARRRSTERLLFAGLAGMPVMHFAWAGYLMGGPSGAPELWEMFGRWASLIAAIAILAWPGQEFLLGAWRDLRNRRPGMDVPVVLGLGAAFTASVWATVTGGGEVYFDSIAMFVFLVLLARRLEMLGRWRAAAPLDRLARVTPRTARRLTGVGDVTEEEVPAIDLVAGDRVRVLPGETVPADGVLERGEGRFDESVLTGEPHPVTRDPGDMVVGGARNLEQTILVRLQRPARESLLGEVRALLQKGLGERPRSLRVIERVAGRFVVGVLFLAAATALLWWWLAPERVLESTIAVLIVTCPCALALAVPSAYAVGVGRLAELGIVPTRASALEPMAAARVAVFDKTGTLTRPRLNAAASWSADGRLDQYLAVAAALEREAVHPLAAAFTREARHETLAVTHHRAVLARGVEGRVAGKRWRLGSTGFIGEELPLGPAIQRRIAEREQTHGRVVVLADERQVWALFVLDEALREDAPETIRALRHSGIERLVLLSGDTGPGVRRVGEQIGADEWHGGLSPAQKLAFVERLQAAGERVLAVGDGINDAPVLGAADVSAAVPGAAQLAQVGSDFVLLDGGLLGLARARCRARALQRIVRQNLAWAIGYNLAAVPAAALGFIPPWGAALGMSLSSMLVVGNSLRLSRRGAAPDAERTAPLAAVAAPEGNEVP